MEAKEIKDTMTVFKAVSTSGGVSWHSSRSSALAHNESIKVDIEGASDSVTEIKLPKDKKNMLVWLNENVKS